MKRAAAIVLSLMVFAAFAPASVQSPLRIEIAVDLVHVNFTATDRRGRMAPGLTAQDFVVEEDGKPQTISLFASERELPLTLAVLIDVSPSVAPVFDEEKNTASKFINSVMGSRDLALVISFNSGVTLLQDFTEDVSTLQTAILNLKLSGTGTSLYDAVYLAAEEKLSREVGKKAIVLISDGEDTTSTYNSGKAMIAAHRNNVVIYAISNSGGSGTLRRMTEETGGAFFQVRREGDFTKAFDQIALELRTQYSLGYHSTNRARDGSFRRIRIIPKDSDIRVRARRGYYAAQDVSTR
jgi:VWFA-related protein